MEMGCLRKWGRVEFHVGQQRLEAGAPLCSPPPSQGTVPGTRPVLSQHVLSRLKVRHRFAAELSLVQPLEKKDKS